MGTLDNTIGLHLHAGTLKLDYDGCVNWPGSGLAGVYQSHPLFGKSVSSTCLGRGGPGCRTHRFVFAPLPSHDPPALGSRTRSVASCNRVGCPLTFTAEL